MAKKLKRPFQDVLPPLSTEELDTLKLRIKSEGGIHDPVLVTEDDEILDGHNRDRIRGAQYETKVIPGSGKWSTAEKQAFVYRAGRGKRHMSAPQWKEYGIPIAKELKKQGRTQKQIAELLGVEHTTISNWMGGGTNSTVGITSPDCRVKVPPQLKPVIADRVNSGESTASVAAEYKVTQRQIRNIVSAETKQAEKKTEREATAKKIKTNCGVIEGDFRVGSKGLEDASVSLIFTDPPYDKGAAELYGDLATEAARLLAPGGWLLAYSGHAHLPEVYAAFSGQVTYAWTFCVLHSGGDLRFRKYRLHNAWKPIVAAFKPPLSVDWEWFKDVVSGGKEKADHEWQQAESEAAYFIDRLCPAGGLVCDPFCGSGTTLVAAKRLGRTWIGYEKDAHHVETARIRIDDTPSP